MEETPESELSVCTGSEGTPAASPFQDALSDTEAEEVMVGLAV